MKPLISKTTEDYLKSLDTKNDQDVINYQSNLDELESIIFETGLKIAHVFIDKQLNLLLLVLSNKKIIKRELSDFSPLVNCSDEELLMFENEETGIHWPKLDYDLSLKGFLRHEIAYIDKPFTI